MFTDLSPALAQVASGGGVSLNNSGDTITIRDKWGEVMATATYVDTASPGESLVLAPEVTGGVFVAHGDASGASGNISPGCLVTGSNFDGTGGLDLKIVSIILLDPTTVELKFTGTASHPHFLFSDPDLEPGFDDPVTISTGTLTTDINGVAIVPFPFVSGQL